MLEIIVLVGAVSWIARAARTRDVSAWLFGSAAVIGYLVLPFVLATVLHWLLFQEPVSTSPGTIAADVIVFVSGWLWVGAVALYVSRVPGRERTQPPGRWSCRSCTYLNDSFSLKCDACGEPYREPSRT